jgi:gamma-glutamyl-gamma-aminobutyrate hydrolase PuuD
MFAEPTSPVRLAVYGSSATTPGRGVGLWNAGYDNFIRAADATPVFLKNNRGDRPWDEVLKGSHGVVVTGHVDKPFAKGGDLESLCVWAKKHKFPLLAIDQGMLALNASFGGLNYMDLARELPDALQHRHPPEPGVRHAINVQEGTILCGIFGEGEIVVNSEHRAGIQRLAMGFRVSGTALDGVIEAIEFATDAWFAMGVQWQPASGSASGLDIQVFRAVIDAAKRKYFPATVTTKTPLAVAV